MLTETMLAVEVPQGAPMCTVSAGQVKKPDLIRLVERMDRLQRNLAGRMYHHAGQPSSARYWLAPAVIGEKAGISGVQF